ncbi:MAG: SDR family NAD(P)-dependent oxidoreductase [Anaerolineales bacterium]|nr:SDR family NAD(P)-dependent oxidoreductase [Anaerolineales bacterium]
MADLEGIVALVTGASSGIGEAAARAFGERGAHVVLTARRADKLTTLAEQIRAGRNGAEALVVPGDLTAPGEPERIAADALAWKGRVDVLVNNAGAGRMRFLEDLDPQADIRPVLELDLTAPILLARALLPAMIRRKSGTIVNVSSVSGLIGMPTSSIYCAAKFGMNGFSDALRREARGMGVRVCLLCPGPVRTEFGRHSGRLPGAVEPSSLAIAIPAAKVGECIADLVRRPRRCVVIPWYYAPAAWLTAQFPGLADRLMELAYTRRLRRMRGSG